MMAVIEQRHTVEGKQKRSRVDCFAAFVSITYFVVFVQLGFHFLLVPWIAYVI